MSLIKIDFNFSPHKDIIMKLCSRNDFYEDDVYTEINRDLPTNLKNNLIKISGVKNYEKNIQNQFLGLNNFGYFILVEENLKKKVVGFIIYNVKEKINRSELLFILIDKKYQNNGYGTKLLNKYIQDINEKEIGFSIVKIENNETGNFYKKIGFKDIDSDINMKVLCYIGNIKTK